MKLVQASLCVRKDIGSSFHHYGGLANVVHGSFSVGKDSENSSHHCGSPERLMHTCFSMRNLDSSIPHCGGHMKIV